MKAISPFIAEILLIGLTIVIAGIIITWGTGFTHTSTQTIEQQSGTQLICSYGGISIYDNIIYKDGYVSGYVINTGNIPLKVNLQIVYDDGTSQEILNVIPELMQGNVGYFSVVANPNILFILIYTNCTAPPVNIRIEKDEIIFE